MACYNIHVGNWKNLHTAYSDSFSVDRITYQHNIQNGTLRYKKQQSKAEIGNGIEKAHRKMRAKIEIAQDAVKKQVIQLCLTQMKRQPFPRLNNSNRTPETCTNHQCQRSKPFFTSLRERLIKSCLTILNDHNNKHQLIIMEIIQQYPKMNYLSIIRRT